ncbi:MAG TPA: hypothetical protein DHW82_10850 [Spirochaetia bacterium]|nr:hypothetical protein [Spirochaetia bacterium]
MNAIREMVKPINHKIIIELPKNFREDDEYEVIILSKEDKKNKKEKFFNLAGNIDIDDKAVNQLREDSIL